MADELFKYDAINLSELIRKGEITPAELLETTIHRLAAQLEQARPWADKNPSIHCINML